MRARSVISEPAPDSPSRPPVPARSVETPPDGMRIYDVVLRALAHLDDGADRAPSAPPAEPRAAERPFHEPMEEHEPYGDDEDDEPACAGACDAPCDSEIRRRAPSDPKPIGTALVSIPPPRDLGDPEPEASWMREVAIRAHAEWAQILGAFRCAGIRIEPTEHRASIFCRMPDREAVQRVLDTHLAASGDAARRDARMMRERIVELGADRLYAPEMLVARVQHTLDDALVIRAASYGVELRMGGASIAIRRIATHARQRVVRIASATAIDAVTFVRAVDTLLALRGLGSRLVPLVAPPGRARFVIATPMVAARLAAAHACPLTDSVDRHAFCAW